MQRVLVDTSTLLDLVLLLHRRNRYVASSAAGALESLVIYDEPIIDAATCEAIIKANAGNRFLRHYCDDGAEIALQQFNDLRTFCRPITLSFDSVTRMHDRGVSIIESILTEIADPSDLRAYELYDYLPYHLGEDPTAIECRLIDMSASDLETINVEPNQDWPRSIFRFTSCLRRKLHPTRASWALPLLRLFYYQAIQEACSVHFVPHGTKSTIAFGREAETVKYRRLLSYCNEMFCAAYLTRASQIFGGLMLSLPVPAFASHALQHCKSWLGVVDLIVRLRDNRVIAEYRTALRNVLERLETIESIETVRRAIEEEYSHLRHKAEVCGKDLGTGGRFRSVRVAIPFVPHSAAELVPAKNAFMLIHDLYSANG